LFSYQPLSEPELDALFSDIRWKHQRAWQAYPRLHPRVHPEKGPAWVLDRHLYYLNAFEPLISTMESETVSAKNVARLAFRDLFA